MRFLHSLAACSFLLVTVPAQASLITFMAGNVPPFGGVSITQGSHPVVGVVDGMQVDFTSVQSLSAPASGEAKVIAVDSKGKEVATTDLAIALDSKTQGFDKLIFDAHLTSGKGGFGGIGDVYLTVKGIDKLGNVFELDNVKDPGGFTIGKGENLLTIVANDGAVMTSVEITATKGWTETKQVRMDGLGPIPIPLPPPPPPPPQGPSPVPEPSTMGIALLGLIGIVGRALRRQSKV
jgi:hypothetical protein